MTDPGPELDPEIGVLLDAERMRPDLDPALQARMFARVATSVGAGVGAAGAGSSAAAASKPWWAMATTFVAGGLVGALLTWSLRPPPTERTVTVERRIEVPVPVTVVVSAPTPAPSLGATGGVVPSVGAPKAAVSGTSSADEDVAIQQIHSALGRGDTSAALAAVAAHEKRFPNGQQADAREALAVQALTKAGRNDEAAARAARFKKRFPGSFYTSIVDQALGNPK